MTSYNVTTLSRSPIFQCQSLEPVESDPAPYQDDARAPIQAGV